MFLCRSDQTGRTGSHRPNDQLDHRELRRWGIERPRLAVAALNPHGAEGGLFGMEEASEIAPAIEACQDIDDINVQGPFSADTVFCGPRAASLMQLSPAITIRR